MQGYYPTVIMISMSSKVLKIKYCRSCKSKKLTKVYSLGKQSLTGIFPPKRNSRVTVGQLSMVLCSKCKLLQLENNFNPYEMYGDNYGYMSSLNKSMVSHLKSFPHLKY